MLRLVESRVRCLAWTRLPGRANGILAIHPNRHIPMQKTVSFRYDGTLHLSARLATIEAFVLAMLGADTAV
jgi:hypothetical protein